MAKVKFASVDEYLAAQPEGNRAALERVRSTIRKALGKRGEEVISYQIPAYRVDGELAIFFAGWKQHYSLHPVTAKAAGAFEKEIARYEKSKGTVRFPMEEAVPVGLVGRIAKFLAGEAAERAAVRAVKKAAKQAAKKAGRPAAKRAVKPAARKSAAKSVAKKTVKKAAKESAAKKRQ